MSRYRDDREALHHRVAQLEQELLDARRAGEEHGRDQSAARAAELEQKLAGMQRELAGMGSELAALRGTKPKLPYGGMVAMLCMAAVLLAMAVGVATFLARPRRIAVAPAEPVAVPAAPLPAIVPATRVTPAATLSAPEPAPEPPRSTTAKWVGTATRIEGVAIPNGTLCTIEATISTRRTNALVEDLAITCGGQKLYRKSDRFSGMAQMSNDARELLGAADDQSTFTLQYRDIGTRTGERTQTDLDTTKQQGTVFRETLPRFRVDFAVPSASVPTAPLARRLRRTGKVTEVTGAAPVKEGASCVLRALATGEGEHCASEVTCGATVLFPKSAPIGCTYDGSMPSGITSEPGPNELSLVDATLTVKATAKAKAFGTVIALDPPPADERDKRDKRDNRGNRDKKDE